MHEDSTEKRRYEEAAKDECYDEYHEENQVERKDGCRNQMVRLWRRIARKLGFMQDGKTPCVGGEEEEG